MKLALQIYVALLVLSLLLWPMLMIASVMSFDAPGSEANILVHLLLYWSVAYPVPILFGAIAQWRTRATATVKRTALFAGIASLSIVTPVILFTLLEIKCNGQFACNG